MRIVYVFLVFAVFSAILSGCGGPSQQQSVQTIGSITPGQQPAYDVELLFYAQGKADTEDNPVVQQQVTDLLPAGESAQFEVAVPAEGIYDLVVRYTYAESQWINDELVVENHQGSMTLPNATLTAPSTNVGVLNINMPVP